MRSHGKTSISSSRPQPRISRSSKNFFSELETLARPEIPLASNTSTFPIGDIGRHLKTRSRVVGLHYFMPAHLVPLVEIIQADFTDPKVGDALEAQQKALGKAPVA